jgi:DNA mismatch endonuclease (patch repair protein)
LPGKPDIVLPKFKAVIFVHGCFWHCHDCRYGIVKPATRSAFWIAKRESNVERDRKNKAALKALGWRVMVIWECEIRDLNGIQNSLSRFLKNSF